MLWGYLTLLPICAMYIVTAVLSRSFALRVYAVQCPIAITVQSFSIYAIRQAIGQNTLRFPYGTGKLENFSAFLCGVLYVPTGLYMAYDATMRLVAPREVGYILGIVPIVISVVRMVFLYLAIHHLAGKTAAPSPILRSYLIDYRVGLLGDLGVLVSFAVGWTLVHYGLPQAGNLVDPAIGLALAIYMVWAGAWLVWHNFRALMDLPLPENEQLRVMKILAAHFADYETIGTVYTRASGKLRFVEIELVFSKDHTLKEIEALNASMERALAEELPGLSFRIIPVATV
jgi:cation diffusion facilitator family transporter